MAKEAVVEIRNLSKSYGDKIVLNNISLDIHKGEIIGYIGPNGAGKSTTVKILLGMVEGYNGTIRILGQDISHEKIDYKYKIGYVPENGEIFDSLTGYEYLMFVGEIYGMGCEEIEKKSKTLTKLFNISEALHSRINSYSKGMKQKLLIIASMMHDPDILFLDEPLSGLDANSVMVFKEILAELSRKGKTIFYSSHIMEVVEKISNRIILINKGEIVADGTFEELKEKNAQGSLESIFNQLTGFNEHKRIAELFVETVQGV